MLVGIDDSCSCCVCAAGTQAKIAYHDITDEPDKGPSAFKIHVKHRVLFKPQDVTQVPGEPSGGLPSMMQTQLAARVDSKLWKGAWADIVWSVKWSQNGLTPIRPHVLVTEPVSLAVEMAILLK